MAVEPGVTYGILASMYNMNISVIKQNDQMYGNKTYRIIASVAKM